MNKIITETKRAIMNRYVLGFLLVFIAFWYMSSQPYGRWLNQFIDPAYRALWNTVPLSLGRSFIAQLLSYWIRHFILFFILSLLFGNIARAFISKSSTIR